MQKNDSINDGIFKICQLGCECEYTLIKKKINELKKKKNS